MSVFTGHNITFTLGASFEPASFDAAVLILEEFTKIDANDKSSSFFKKIFSHSDIDKYTRIKDAYDCARAQDPNLEIFTGRIEGGNFSENLDYVLNKAGEYTQIKTVVFIPHEAKEIPDRHYEISEKLKSKKLEGKMGKAQLLFSKKVKGVDDAINLIEVLKLNSEYCTFLPINEKDKNVSELKFSSSVAGMICRYIKKDPATPLFNREIKGVFFDFGFLLQERKSLFDNRMSTFRISPTGQTIIENMVTTSSEDGNRYLEKFFSLIRIENYFVHMLNETFTGFNVTNDGAIIPPGNKITTPSLIHSAISSICTKLERDGIIENANESSKRAIVEKKEGGEVVININFNLMDQWRSTVMSVSYI